MPAPSVLDFTAIDFETANRQRASVCAVGLARVRGGVIVATDSWLVVPPTGADDFDAGNIRVHGIRPRDVRRTGIDWRQSLARIEAFRGGSALIAHNASFDQSVYAESCRALGLTPPSTRWEDTLRIARQHLSLPDHKLPTVAEHLGLASFQHHDAAADAEVCARIADLTGAGDVDGLWPLRPKPTGSSRWSSDRASTAKVSDLPQPAADADPRHPLHGHRIVLTGELDGMDRWTAFERIAAAGGTPQKNITLKTTMLIVSGRPRLPDGYRPELGSQKERKAAEYRDRGNDISFLGHEELQEALAWRSGASARRPPAVSTAEPALGPLPTPPERTGATGPRTDDRPVSPRPAGQSGSGDERRPFPPSTGSDQCSPAPPHRPSARKDPAAAPSRPGPQHAPVSRPEPAMGPAATTGATPAPQSPVWTRSQPPAPRAGEVSRPAAPHWSGSAGSPEQRTSRGAASIGRKVTGWILLIVGTAVTLMLLLVALVGLLTPEEDLGIKIIAMLMIIIAALLSAGAAFLGVYLIWLRDRRRSRRR